MNRPKISSEEKELAEKIIELGEKATPGPWLHVNHGDWIEGPDDNQTIILGTTDSKKTENAAFIEYVRNHATQLAHAYLAQSAMLAEAMEVLGRMADPRMHAIREWSPLSEAREFVARMEENIVR